MAYGRRHRGPHPEDAAAFARATWPALRQAVEHFSWLLTRGYAVTSALKLVGDRFRLTERQRMAVWRSSCSDAARDERIARRVPVTELADARLAIDGFNLLTTIEAALAGGVLLLGRDGCCRDLASVHGTYRKVDETRPALVRIGQWLEQRGVAHCRWLLDQPVSNSGRLAALIRTVALESHWDWEVAVVPSPDRELRVGGDIVATSDSAILDHAARSANVAAEIVRTLPTPWLIDLMDTGQTPDSPLPV